MPRATGGQTSLVSPDLRPRGLRVLEKPHFSSRTTRPCCAMELLTGRTHGRVQINGSQEEDENTVTHVHLAPASPQLAAS